MGTKFETEIQKGISTTLILKQSKSCKHVGAKTDMHDPHLMLRRDFEFKRGTSRYFIILSQMCSREMIQFRSKVNNLTMVVIKNGFRNVTMAMEGRFSICNEKGIKIS